MQNKELWRKIYSGNGRGRDIYVLEEHYPAWETIRREYKGNYYMTTVLRAVYALNSIAVPRRPWGLLRRRGLEKLEFDGAAIHYSLDNDGNVRICCLEVNSDYRSRGGSQKTGLYKVERDGDQWITLNKLQTKMELSHRWPDGSHYAAVAGKFDDKEQAGRILIEHIRNAYKAAVKEEDINRPGIHYSLYWQNGGIKSDKHRDHLASLIQQAMRVGTRLNWLVHGEGAGTFVRALQLLEKQFSPVPIPETSKREERLRKYLKRQAVFFSNPRGKGTEEKELKALCDKVGIDCAGVNINSYDLLNIDVRKKALKKGLSVGAVLLTGGSVIDLTGLQDIPATIINTLTQMSSTESAFATALVGAGGCYLVYSKYSSFSAYVRNLPTATVRTVQGTFGKGNQRWAA